VFFTGLLIPHYHDRSRSITISDYESAKIPVPHSAKPASRANHNRNIHGMAFRLPQHAFRGRVPGAHQANGFFSRIAGKLPEPFAISLFRIADDHAAFRSARSFTALRPRNY
jgi:hypothetical protein